MARQTIRIRVRRTGGGGPYKPCNNCGGTGVVRGGRNTPANGATRK